jgi:pilus assembly protein FimV
MSLKTYQNMSIVGKVASVAAVVTLLMPMAVDAATLGKITVKSALGQPLKAEIDLSNVTQAERANLVANLAKPEDFEKAQITMDPALAALQFTVKQDGERDLIEVTSASPVNVAMVNVLVEVTGGRRRLLREYSFLLDPVRTANAATKVNVAAPTPTTVMAASPVKGDAEVKSPAPNKEDAASAGDYAVVQGDMLSKIALRYKPKGVSLNQMMIALYRANPDAFIDNNINRLKAGKVLALPSSNAVRAVDATQAREVVIAHAEDFEAYRNQLAGKVGAAAAKKPARAAQSGEGKVTVKVLEDKAPANAPQDKLTLSRADPNSSQQGQSDVTSEDKIAAEKAKAEALARANALEKSMSDMQKLLELKNQSLANAQNAGESAPVVTNDTKPDLATAGENAALASAEADTTPAQVAEQIAVGEQADRVYTFLDKLKERAGSISANPITWPIVGGLIVLIAGLAVFFMRRRRADEPLSEEETLEDEVAAAAPFADMQEATEADDAPSAETLAQEQENEGDLQVDVSGLADPVPEADGVNAPVADLSEKIDFDLELDSGKPAEEVAAVPAEDELANATVGNEANEADEMMLDLPQQDGNAIPATASAAIDEKLELDLPPVTSSATPAAPLTAAETAFGVELNMKLDLAAAYQEIGDVEGARELLDEVVNGGNEELAVRAREMLRQLG